MRQFFFVGDVRIWNVMSVLLESLLMLFEGHYSSFLSWFPRTRFEAFSLRALRFKKYIFKLAYPHILYQLLLLYTLLRTIIQLLLCLSSLQLLLYLLHHLRLDFISLLLLHQLVVFLSRFLLSLHMFLILHSLHFQFYFLYFVFDAFEICV